MFEKNTQARVVRCQAPPSAAIATTAWPAQQQRQQQQYRQLQQQQQQQPHHHQQQRPAIAELVSGGGWRCAHHKPACFCVSVVAAALFCYFLFSSLHRHLHTKPRPHSAPNTPILTAMRAAAGQHGALCRRRRRQRRRRPRWWDPPARLSVCAARAAAVCARSPPTRWLRARASTRTANLQGLDLSNVSVFTYPELCISERQ